MITYVRKAGTTDVSVVIRIIDSGDGTPETGVEHDTTGIDLEYRREGATSTDITEAALSALNDAHADGGIEHIGGGYYRLDLPDAACASGASGVLIHGTITGMVVIGCYIQLVAYDPFDTVRLGLTALPNAAADAAGGLPISDAGGLDLDAQIGTKINSILQDTETTLQGELDGIQADTEDIQSRLPTSLVSGRMDASVGAMEANVLTASAINADAITAAKLHSDVTTELQSGLATQASVDTIDNLLDTEFPALTAAINGMILASGTIGATGNDTTHLHLDGLGYADDAINSMLISIKDVSTGLYYSRWIEDFATTGDLATVATLPFTPEASTDQYWILPVRADVTGGSGLDAAGVRAAIGLASANLDTQLGDLPTAAEIRAEIDSNSTQLAEIVEDTGTTLDDLVDNIEARLGTPSDLGSGATIAANLVDIEGQTDDIGAAGAGLTELATAVELAKVPKSDSNVTWNATALASIQSEATDALNAYDPPTKAELDSGLDALPTAAENADAVWDEATTGHTTGGTFGEQVKTDIDAILEDTSTTLQNEVDGIQADTEDIQSRLPAALTGDGNIKADALKLNGAAPNNLSAAQVNSEVVDALTVDVVADSVAADGSRPTIAQAVYEVLQFLTEKSVSGTTVTVNKPDGSTSLMTFTLDDGSAPTSITRSG